MLLILPQITLGRRFVALLWSFGTGHLDTSQILKWTLNVHKVVYVVEHFIL